MTLLLQTPQQSLANVCRYTADLKCLHPLCLRKGTLLFNNIFSIVPAIMMGCSEIARSFEIIIVARFIVGICAGWIRKMLFATNQCILSFCFLCSAGLSSNVVPMYLGELAPKNLRGALGIVPQLFITIGILCAQVLGIRQILGNNTGTIISPSLVLLQQLSDD